MEQTLGVHHVRLFLDIAEVLGLRAFVAQALFVGMQHDITLTTCYFVSEIERLWNVVTGADGKTVGNTTRQFNHRFLTHSINKNVGRGIAKNTRAKLVLPIVIMGESAQRGLDAAQDDGHSE